MQVSWSHNLSCIGKVERPRASQQQTFCFDSRRAAYIAGESLTHKAGLRVLRDLRVKRTCLSLTFHSSSAYVEILSFHKGFSL